MTTVYVVQGSETYDYYIKGVWTTLAAAEAYLDEELAGEGWIEELTLQD